MRDCWQSNRYTIGHPPFPGQIPDFTPDVLEILFKGVNYDNDLGCAERAAEVRGRNERILLEKRQSDGDTLPGLHNNRSSRSEEEENLTPGFGLRRRRSVWDM